MHIDPHSPKIRTVEKCGEESIFYENTHINRTPSISMERVFSKEIEGSSENENCMRKIYSIFLKFLDFLVPRYFR